MADGILAIVYAVMFEGGGLLVLKLLVHVFAVWFVSIHHLVKASHFGGATYLLAYLSVSLPGAIHHVYRLSAHPTQPSSLISAVNYNNEVSVWDMETVSRRQMLWASPATPFSPITNNVSLKTSTHVGKSSSRRCCLKITKDSLVFFNCIWCACLTRFELHFILPLLN